MNSLRDREIPAIRNLRVLDLGKDHDIKPETFRLVDGHHLHRCRAGTLGDLKTLEPARGFTSTRSATGIKLRQRRHHVARTTP